MNIVVTCIGFLFALVSATIVSAESRQVKTTIVTAFGASIDEASKNAAKNALTQIVGSFLDSETLLQEQTIIQNGIGEQTSSITSETNEYSQGTIKYFEILDASNTDDLFQVTARVDVRIDDFKAYIKSFDSDSIDIGQGLLTGIIANVDNDMHEKEILDRTVKQILSGEFHEVDVKAPLSFDNVCGGGVDEYLILMDEYNSLGTSKIQSDDNRTMEELCSMGWGWEKNANEVRILFPVELKFQEGFIQRLVKTLESTSDKVINLGSRSTLQYKHHRSQLMGSQKNYTVAGYDLNYEQYRTHDTHVYGKVHNNSSDHWISLAGVSPGKRSTYINSNYNFYSSFGQTQREETKVLRLKLFSGNELVSELNIDAVGELLVESSNSGGEAGNYLNVKEIIFVPISLNVETARRITEAKVLIE